MANYNRLRSIVFTITTAIVFFSWTLLADFIKANLVFGVPLSMIISLGTYRLILKFVEFIVLKINVVKKCILGNAYLEGKWIGFYIGINNLPRFYIEYFEQDFESLLIRGFCYNDDGSFKGTWTSDKVYINEQKGTIAYTYETNMIDSTNKNQGLAFFDFVREDKRKAANKLVGFSSDIFVPKKLKSFERKLSKEELKLDDISILELAKEFYKESDKLIQ